MNPVSEILGTIHYPPNLSASVLDPLLALQTEFPLVFRQVDPKKLTCAPWAAAPASRCAAASVHPGDAFHSVAPVRMSRARGEL